jgi:RNA polymerase sigma factor (sigma-70 family)
MILHVRITKERENPDEQYSFVTSILSDHLKLPKGSQPFLWFVAHFADAMGHPRVHEFIRDLFIVSHLGIVKKIAWQIVHKRLGGDRTKAPRLIADGNYGLVRAWRTFNALKGTFNTHANFWIRKFMFRGLRRSVVRVPQGTVVIPDRSLTEVIPDSADGDRVNNAGATYEDALTANERQHREWQTEESAEEREEDYALEYMRRLAERILSPREHRVFIARYFSPKVLLRELAVEFGVTEGMVRKIGRRALAKIRKGLKNE